MFVSASVVINEIAWMGTAVSANDEWMELYNTGSETVDLTGWRVTAADGQPDITLDANICTNTSIPVGGYFLLERTDDETVSGISADCIYTGALGNAGEQLQLLTASGAGSDTIIAIDGWPAGDNTAKETMQRSGGGWITSAPTPKAANASASSGNDNHENTNTNTQNQNNENNSSSSSNSTSSSGGGSSGYVQPEDMPRITVSAGKDRQAVVGEEVQFRGEAWGLQDEPLENARFLWNFGDGGTKEGKNVGHAYMFPGTYIIRVTASSGKYTAFDDVSIVVGENGVVVSEIKPGDDGWVELENKSAASVHIGGWILESAHHQFIIPSGTMIAPHTLTVLSRMVTNITLQSEGDHIHMFYPNGTYAAGFSYIFKVMPSMSVSFHDNAAVFTEPTPGKQNLVSPAAESAVINVLAPVKNITAPTPKAVVQNIAASIKKPVVQTVKEEPVSSSTAPASAQTASVFSSAPPPSKKWHEAAWFAGSLVAGGLLAVIVVLFRRKKEQSELDI